jgi:hypothetical protein
MNPGVLRLVENLHRCQRARRNHSTNGSAVTHQVQRLQRHRPDTSCTRDPPDACLLVLQAPCDSISRAALYTRNKHGLPVLFGVPT